MTRGPLARLAALVALLAAAALAPALRAQDLAPRRGFKVEIVEPKSGSVVSGKTTLRAAVTAPREEDVEKVDFFVDDKLVFSDTAPPWQVVHDFGKKGGTHVVRVLATHRDGPTTSAFVVTKSVELQFVVNVQRVLLDVSVRDAQHRVMQGLSQDNFRVTEDGKPQKVLSVTTDKRPLAIAIVLDSSGSMKERMIEAQEAACDFIEALTEKDRALIINFDDNVFLIHPASADHASLCKSIRSTEALGGTALYEALRSAYRLLHQTDAERRAIVVLSDGDDTQSRIDFKEVMDVARLSDVTVYAIGLQTGGLSQARQVLRELADETGGRAYFVTEAKELAGTYETIAEELRTLYQVVYASDNQVFDGRFVPIGVEIVGVQPGSDVRHRRGYRAVEP
ncbi:MAG: VWA domain-containing protein [Acidobacteria bacterium]|nr:VWA domain-containing protein [Acidobacteriota bacterium]